RLDPGGVLSAARSADGTARCWERRGRHRGARAESDRMSRPPRGIGAMSLEHDAAGLSRSLTRSRRTKDRAFGFFIWACGVLALLPLAFIAFYVIKRGVAALNLAFFTKEPEPPGVAGGGIVQSFIGSGIIVGISILISVPLGVL